MVELSEDYIRQLPSHQTIFMVACLSEHNYHGPFMTEKEAEHARKYEFETNEDGSCRIYGDNNTFHRVIRITSSQWLKAILYKDSISVTDILP